MEKACGPDPQNAWIKSDGSVCCDLLCRMKRWIVFAVVSLSVLAIGVVAFAGSRPASKPITYPATFCDGSPYPSLAEGQFNTIAVDCSGA